MLERGVQVGDVLICDEGARPKSHHNTGRHHVRISPRSIIDDTEPRFFIHGFPQGLVAYVPEFVQDADNTQVIQPETKFRVMLKLISSVVLQQVENCYENK